MLLLNMLIAIYGADVDIDFSVGVLKLLFWKLQ